MRSVCMDKSCLRDRPVILLKADKIQGLLVWLYFSEERIINRLKIGLVGTKIEGFWFLHD